MQAKQNFNYKGPSTTPIHDRYQLSTTFSQSQPNLKEQIQIYTPNRLCETILQYLLLKYNKNKIKYT